MPRKLYAMRRGCATSERRPLIGSCDRVWERSDVGGVGRCLRSAVCERLRRRVRTEPRGSEALLSDADLLGDVSRQAGGRATGGAEAAGAQRKLTHGAERGG